MGDGAARQSKQSESHPAKWPQRSFARQAEVIKTESSENLKALTGRKVDTCIETVLLKWTGAGAHEVILYKSIRRRWKQTQNVQGLGRKSADRNQKWSRAISRRWI